MNRRPLTLSSTRLLNLTLSRTDCTCACCDTIGIATSTSDNLSPVHELICLCLIPSIHLLRSSSFIKLDKHRERIPCVDFTKRENKKKKATTNVPTSYLNISLLALRGGGFLLLFSIFLDASDHTIHLVYIKTN